MAPFPSSEADLDPSPIDEGWRGQEIEMRSRVSRAGRRVAVIWGAAALVAAAAGCSSAAGTATDTASLPTVPVTSAATPAPASTGTITASPSRSSGASPQNPVLGSAATGPTGYGSVRPSRIDGGQDSSGLLEDVHWSSWGGPQATGTGTASYVGPNQPLAQATPETATVVALDRGTCDGKPAYRKLTWYFPQHGQHLDPDAALTVCR